MKSAGTITSILEAGFAVALALALALGGCILVGPAPSSGKGGGDAVVCHKGKTMTLPSEAVAGHLGHGDSRGPC